MHVIRSDGTTYRSDIGRERASAMAVPSISAGEDRGAGDGGTAGQAHQQHRIDAQGFYSERDVLMLGVGFETQAQEREAGRLRFTSAGGVPVYRGQDLLDWLSGKSGTSSRSAPAAPAPPAAAAVSAGSLQASITPAAAAAVAISGGAGLIPVPPLQGTDPMRTFEPISASPVGDRRIDFAVSADDKLLDAAVEALAHRLGVGGARELSPEARDVRNVSLVQLAEVCLQRRGVHTWGMLPEDLARLALDGPQLGMADGYQRPSDFPVVLSNLAGRVLDDAMQYSPATFREWAAPIPSVKDFKPATIARTGEFAELPRVPDGDNFEASDVGEEASWIAVDRYGDEWMLTPVMIANDDLGAFADALTDKQVAHDLTLNRLCVNLLAGNVAAADGVPLFHEDHGNDRAAGGPPDTGELAAIRLLLRQQRGINQRRTLAFKLQTLLVPSKLETVTEQLLANALNVVPVTEGTAQIFRGRVSWAVEPMLDEHSETAYYGFPDRRIGRAIRYTFMRGFERMRVSNYVNPRNGCRHWQFEGRFAAAVDNWRAAVRNAGTGG